MPRAPPSLTFLQTEAAGGRRGGGRSHRAGRESSSAFSSVSKASPTLHQSLSIPVELQLLLGATPSPLTPPPPPPPPGAGCLYLCSNSGQTPPPQIGCRRV